MPSQRLAIAVLLVASAFCSPRVRLQAQPSPPAIDPTLAAQYFREAQQVCSRDAGQLWGKSLCGPMLFVDDATRNIVANQADKEGLLTEKDGVFVGNFRRNSARPIRRW